MSYEEQAFRNLQQTEADLREIGAMFGQAKSLREADVVRGILKRAENHLVYLRDKGSSPATIAEQERYVEAAETVLSRLY